MLRCAASFVIAAYDKYASFLRICTPCLRTFYKTVRKLTFYEDINIDGFVKSPDAALRCILRRCGVPKSTPHSLRLCAPCLRTFYKTVRKLTFYEGINIRR
jgi:ribosomal protein L28